MFIDVTACLRRRFSCFSYFESGVLVLVEGDAAGGTAGEGLATWLGVVTGALTVELGEGDAAAGLAVGVVDSLTGSLEQPAANEIETIVSRRSTMRLILFIFEVLITFCLVRARLKSRDDDCSNANCQQWVFPQNVRGDLRLVCTESLVLEMVLARLANGAPESRPTFAAKGRG